MLTRADLAVWVVGTAKVLGIPSPTVPFLEELAFPTTNIRTLPYFAIGGRKATFL